MRGLRGVQPTDSTVTGSAGTLTLGSTTGVREPPRPAIRHPTHPACPCRALVSRTRIPHCSRGRRPGGLPQPARCRAAGYSADEIAVLHDWFSRSTNLALAYIEEWRPKDADGE